ncbi:MAG: BREX-2 system phosphatase PglZ [Mycobacteriales bacterium]
MTTDAAAGVSVHVLRSLVDDARNQAYRRGVIAVRAHPQWDGPDTLRHGDQTVQVVACASSLAVRSALRRRGNADWLVVLTDRPDEDLGASLLAHFTDCRVRRADPWDAVRSRFAARTLDPALTTVAGHRDLAHGLLAVTPAAGWPPAPAGTLTRAHALRAVARTHLGLPPDDEVDAVTVLLWSCDPQVPSRLAALRAAAGDALVGVLLDWLAERAGPIAPALRTLFAAGALGDAVPLGLVLGLLSAHAVDSSVARDALIRLEPRTGGPVPASVAVAWEREATTVTLGLLADGGARTALARGDELLAAVQAQSLAARSGLLRAGLTDRLEQLAEDLRGASPVGVEAAWGAVRSHRLADGDRRVPVFEAAVRLQRWLALPDPELPSLAESVRRHLETDAYVDVAINDAAGGVGEAGLADSLGRVCTLAQTRRAAHDRAFAVALAREGAQAEPPVPGLERLLPDVVLPLARRTPVLLLVLDGMSCAVAAEIVGDVAGATAQDWVEALAEASPGRAAALAVLPTLTTHSRTSLLTGGLRSGAQDAERAGYAELLRAAGLKGELFHKKPLEQGALGATLAPDVAAALDDVTGRPLVTAVLNSVDDALDRSNPAGTVWDADAVKHLRPLLERARAVGRTVVLTSDHGHVVERRQGTLRPAAGMSSGRSRPAEGEARDDEVLVDGPRVLAHGGRAVLAVDEALRYGPLKAGYHGGGSPAEVVVPVVVLVPGVVPAATPLRAAPPQEPAWWWGPVSDAAAPQVVPEPAAVPTLFDHPVPEPSAAASMATRVLDSATYRAARAAAARVPVTDDAVHRLLLALLDVPDSRLTVPAVAQALGEPPARVRGAVSSVQRLLNVEGYPVLSLDAGGAAYVLDVALLREQFEFGA